MIQIIETNYINQAISKMAYKQFGNIICELNTIKYAIIKGEPLSYLAYGEFGKRKSIDIDILISRMDLQYIEKTFSDKGFFTKTQSRMDRVLTIASSHQAIPWQLSNELLGPLTCDLNIDIFWGEYEGKRIDIHEFLSDTIEMDIYGVKVKTLRPIKAMIQLILHHYKDINSIFLLSTRKRIKSDMFKDVYNLLKNNLDTITLDNLYSISAKYEIIPYVFYVLYYTGQMFEDAILKEYIEAFRTPEGNALLDIYGLCTKEHKLWTCDFKTRLESENLYDLIKDDLTDKDQEKIAINKQIFGGE